METKSFRHSPGSGRHPYSRDWDMPEIKCENRNCSFNYRNCCVMPSVIKIGSDGKCKGFLEK